VRVLERRERAGRSQRSREAVEDPARHRQRKARERKSGDHVIDRVETSPGQKLLEVFR